MNKKHLVTALSILTLSQPLLSTSANAKPINTLIKEHPVVSSVVGTIGVLATGTVLYLGGKAVVSKVTPKSNEDGLRNNSINGNSDPKLAIFEGKIVGNRLIDEAFKGDKSLKTAIIPDSVTKIGYGAFLGCSSLTSITIPNSVNEIGMGTFSD